MPEDTKTRLDRRTYIAALTAALAGCGGGDSGDTTTTAGTDDTTSVDDTGSGATETTAETTTETATETATETETAEASVQQQWSHRFDVDAVNANNYFTEATGDDVFVANAAGAFAFDPDGSVRWSLTDTGSFLDMAVAGDHAFVLTGSGDLLAVAAATGETAWQETGVASTDTGSKASLAAGTDYLYLDPGGLGADSGPLFDPASGDQTGTAGVAGTDFELAVGDTVLAGGRDVTAYDVAAGESRWTVEDVRIALTRPPAVGGDTLFGAADGTFHLIGVTGGDYRTVEAPTGFTGDLPVAAGDRYAAALDGFEGTLYGVDTENDEVAWTADVSGRQPAGPAVASAGFVTVSGDTAQTFDPASGEVVASSATGPTSTPLTVAAADSTAYGCGLSVTAYGLSGGGDGQTGDGGY